MNQKSTGMPFGAIEKPPGIVYLVGGGPGNPELLTLRAARLIAEADVVVFDHLIGPDILALASETAERIYAGKEAGKHTIPQQQINQLLVSLAQAGKRVVRLKGGDPFIFGRGGEEIETLVGQGIAFEVVPGVSAALGMAAYAGIPLTHRDFAQTCIFTTGHLRDGSCHLDWATLARPNQTLVIYMGVGGLETISRELIAHGLPGETPAAIVQNATLPNQRCVAATLASLPSEASSAGITPPAMIVIGAVVNLRERLNWFEPSR